jgi:mycothiol system anti-sigma-R factor
VTCEEAGEMISVLLDGELAVPDIARVQHHLVDCEPCRAAHASETWLHSLLAAGVLSEEPPDSLRRRVLERISDEAASSLGRARRWRGGPLPALIGGGLFTLAALVILIHLERRGTRESPILVDVLAGHRQYTDVSTPHLDIRGDARRVERWIRDRLGLAVRLPSGAGRGEAPVGARVATVAGRPAAQVLYAGEGRRISLFVARKPPQPLPEEGEHIVDGAEVYIKALGASHLGWWQDDKHLYLAVSAAGAEDLLGLAALCIQSPRAAWPPAFSGWRRGAESFARGPSHRPR